MVLALCAFVPRADMREMVQPMTNALPLLQPPKRLRGKAAEDALGQQPARRRRCRVSDEEAEQIRQARDSRLGEEKDTMADTHIMMQHVVPRHCIV